MGFMNGYIKPRGRVGYGRFEVYSGGGGVMGSLGAKIV